MIVWALKTSGPNSYKHGLLELAALDYYRPERRFHEECYLDFRDEISAEAAEQGVAHNHEFRYGKTTQAALVNRFNAWSRRCQHTSILGINTQDELRFVQRAGVFYPDHRAELLDLNQIVHRVQMEANISTARGRGDLSKFVSYVPKDDIRDEVVNRARAYQRLGEIDTIFRRGKGTGRFKYLE